MRRSVLGALAFLFAGAAPLAAENHENPLSVDMRDFEVGAYIVHETDTGPRLRIIRGRENGLWVSEIIRDWTPDGDWVARNYHTINGNLVRQEYPNGRVIRYEPHNCSRVVGECRYTEIREDGRRTMLRISTPKDDGVAVDIYVVGDDDALGLFMRGTIILNEVGLTESSHMVFYQNGRRVRTMTQRDLVGF